MPEAILPCRVRDSVKILKELEANETTIQTLINELKQAEKVEIADALEKISQDHLDQLMLFQTDLLYIAQQAKHPSILWHMLQILGKMTFDRRSLHEIEQIIEHAFYFSDSKIVRTNALQTVIDLAQKYTGLHPLAVRIYKDASVSDVPALQARVKKLKRQIKSEAYKKKSMKTAECL